MIKIVRLPEFEKDLKSLSKKYKSINDDICVVEKVISVDPHARPPFSFQIDGLGLETCVIKVRKIACKSLKGRGAMSGLRLIYAHFEIENKVVFIELYHKNAQSIENKDRIVNNFK